MGLVDWRGSRTLAKIVVVRDATKALAVVVRTSMTMPLRMSAERRAPSHVASRVIVAVVEIVVVVEIVIDGLVGGHGGLQSPQVGCWGVHSDFAKNHAQEK